MPSLQSTLPRRPVWQQLKNPVPDSLLGRQMSSDHCPHKPNITADEHKAIKELREDQSRVVLTVDKGVAMVVIEKQDYTDKAFSYSQTPIHIGSSIRTPSLDSKTNSPALSGTPNKQEDSVTQSTEKCTQLALSPQSFMASPKFTSWQPLRPIMSSRGSITYGVAKELANISCPLVSQSPHHYKLPNILCSTYNR